MITKNNLVQDCWNQILTELANPFADPESDGVDLREARSAISFGCTCKKYYQLVFTSTCPLLKRCIMAWKEQQETQANERINFELHLSALSITRTS